MVQVRESSRFGFCYALGELIGETPTRYIYRTGPAPPSSAKTPLDPPRAVHGVCGRGREGCLAPPPGVDALKKPCSGRAAAMSLKLTPPRGVLPVSAFPQSIVLHCRVTLPFAELRQMFLVEAIDLGLHLGMPALDQDGEFTHQPSRAKPVE